MYHLLIKEVRLLVQNFINSVKNFIETSVKNKRHNKSMFYYFSFTFIIIMYFIFFNANGILPDNSQIMNTDLNKEVDVGSTKLYLTRCEYNKNQKFIEIQFKYADTDDYIKPKLDFSVKAKIDIKTKLNVKTMIATDDTYIIHVENIPKNYEAIALKITQNSNTNGDYSDINASDFSLDAVDNSTISTNSNIISNNSATIYCDYRIVKINNNLEEETQKYYLTNITKSQINDLKKEINDIDTTKKDNNNLINIANTNINDQNNQYKYEIKQEQSNTTQNINNLKANIKSINQQNKDLQNNISLLQDKIEKLGEKINDITGPNVKKKAKSTKPILKKPVKKVKAIAKK